MSITNLNARVFVFVAALFAGANAFGAAMTFGDKDALGFDVYGDSEPTDGASLEGLAVGDVTFSFTSFAHGFPFSPEVSDYSGTDQIYVGSDQTAFGDGYSVFAGRQAGPQTITLDYSPIVEPGYTIDTFTLGIAADDFQAPLSGNPFVALVNGHIVVDLMNELNALVQSGPVVQFFSIGLDPGLLESSNILTLVIDEAGDGRDGWAIDFLTVGVTSSPVPLPPALGLFAMAAISALRLSRRRPPAS